MRLRARAGKSVSELSQGLESFRPGQTGLLRLTWDNGDRTVLVNPELGGVTFGWNLTHYGARRTCLPQSRARRFTPG